MPSTFSKNLRIELPSDGSLAGLWGRVTNRNLGTIIEQAITGNFVWNVSGGNVTLSALNAATDESRNAVLIFEGSSSADITVTIPNVPKKYTVINKSDVGVNIVNIGSYLIPYQSDAYIYANGNGAIYGKTFANGAQELLEKQNPFDSPTFTGTVKSQGPLILERTTFGETEAVNKKYVSDALTAALSGQTDEYDLDQKLGKGDSPTFFSVFSTGPQSEDLNALTRKDYVDDQVTNVKTSFQQYVSGKNFVTNSELNNKGFITNSALNSKGFITKSTLNAYMPKSGGSFSGSIDCLDGISSQAYNFDSTTSIYKGSAGHVDIAINRLPRLTVYSNGNLDIKGTTARKSGGGSWANLSDANLKTNIQPLDSALSKLMQLKPMQYAWKVDRPLEPTAGFLAQDLEQVFPNAVTEVESREDEKPFVGDKTKVMGFQNDIFAYLIGAIQEQQREIEALKAKIGI